MPEGPEIRQAADRIAAAIEQQELTAVFFAFDSLKPYESTLAKQMVTRVEPRGKAMLIRFDNGLNIYSHNQLYGKWMVRNAHSYPDTKRQLRLAIHTPRKSALLYSASDIDVLPNEDLGLHPFLSRIGPDVLDPAMTPNAVAQRLGETAFHRRQLATLLLDQHFLAGLGNYLRSEILFDAGVYPTHRPADCPPEAIRRLGESAIALSRRSYDTGGITNDLDLAMALKAEGLPRRAYRHYVFGRDGKPCYRCSTAIIKETFGGRRCYYCPVCQPTAPSP
ncbi:MAG: endonuclease VIII [Elainellaceae cyanobacterium]